MEAGAGHERKEVIEQDPFSVDEAQSRRRAIEDRYAERKRGDLRRVLSTVEGRRVFWRVLQEARIFHSCFDTNALEMAKKEGRRDLGLFIIEDLTDANADILDVMRREAASDRLQKDVELQNAEKGETKNG